MPLTSLPDAVAMKKLSNGELRHLLESCLMLDPAKVLCGGQAVVELEARGEDLSDLRIGTIQYLRKIGHGQLLPEVFIYFLGHALLHKAARLPLSDQRRLLAPDPLDVAILNNGLVQQVKCRPDVMKPPMIDIVFASDHLRPIEEQIAILRASQVRPPKRSTISPKIDHRKMGVHVREPGFISLSDLKDFIIQLGG